jgi:hypothetical protein
MSWMEAGKAQRTKGLDWAFIYFFFVVRMMMN